MSEESIILTVYGQEQFLQQKNLNKNFDEMKGWDIEINRRSLKQTGKREKSAVIEKSLAVRTRKILLKKNDYIEVWMFEDVIKNLMRHE